MSVDYDRVEVLLNIIERTRVLPKLKAIHDEAMIEVEKIAVDVAEKHKPKPRVEPVRPVLEPKKPDVFVRPSEPEEPLPRPPYSPPLRREPENA